nr:transposase [Streptomyces sp. A144]
MAGVGRLDRRPGSPACGRGSKRELRDPALGRSRGGLTCKIHLACDGRGRPLAFVVTGGNTNDCTRFTTVVEAIWVPRTGHGRPRVRPKHELETRATTRRRSAPGSAAEASPTRFPSGPTRSATGPDEAASEAARQPSTARSTSTATSWNGASTA